jgi:hypothetical protein
MLQRHIGEVTRATDRCACTLSENLSAPVNLEPHGSMSDIRAASPAPQRSEKHISGGELT